MLASSIVVAIAIRSTATATATATVTSPFTLIRQYHAASLPSAPTLPKSIPILNRLSSPFSTTISVRRLGTGALNPRGYDVLATANSPLTLRQYHAASLPSALTLPKSIPVPNRLSSPLSTTSVRGLRSGPLNGRSYEISQSINWSVFCVVPERKACMIERFGEYLKTLPSGIHFLIPLLDRVAYVYSLEEEAIPIPGLSIMTGEKVEILIDGVLYFKVVDPVLAFYGLVNPWDTVFSYAKSAITSAIGNLTLDKILEERERRTLREKIETSIHEKIHEIAEERGLKCRYKILDISLPHKVRAAMEMAAEAERMKRAAMEMMAEAERKKRAAAEAEKESSNYEGSHGRSREGSG